MSEDQIRMIREIKKSQYNTPEEFDEAALRWYVYGSIDLVDPCTIAEEIITGETSEKKFNVKFLTSLIKHMTKCDNCYAYYQLWLSEKP